MKKQTVCLLVKHFFEVTTKNIESLRPRILFTTNVSKIQKKFGGYFAKLAEEKHIP